jgi:carbon-monoxide dehydrogenase large subunit
VAPEQLIGAVVPRPEDPASVTGRAEYAVDIDLPGMLHVALVRSEHPHARLVGVDTSAALAAPGAVAALTGADIPVKRIGYCVSDRPVIAHDRVRSVADIVAAVAAEDRRAAERAAKLVRVEYDPLPAVFSVEEALADGAPLLHEAKAEYAHRDFLTPFAITEPSNLSCHFRLRHGDLDTARARAAVVASDRFTTQRVEHCSLEPHAAVASLDADGRVVLWSSTGKPFRTAQQTALALGLGADELKLIQPVTGGDFGGKGEPTVEPICALLALKTGRPVRAVFTRTDEFRLSTARLPFEIEMAVGASEGGELLFVEADIWVDAGPYNGMAGQVTTLAGAMAPGPYDVAAARVDALCVYTNNTLGGAFRGFGNPQVTWAREQLVDRLAGRLGMDPLELRLRNVWRAGSVTAMGQRLADDEFGVGAASCLEALRSAGGEPERSAGPRSCRRRGRGIAVAQHGMGGGIFAGADTSTTVVHALAEGGILIRTGASDVGQGASTAIAQVVAHELSVSLGSISFVERDTTKVPWEGGASASRIAFLTGHSAAAAARDLAGKLRALAAAALECPVEELSLADGRVVHPSTGREIGFAELAARVEDTPTGTGTFHRTVVQLDENGQGSPFIAFDFGAQLAEVEVDLDTGAVDVLRLVSADDVGRAINPGIVEGQIVGAAVQGLGFATMEELVLANGVPQNAGFAAYRLPRAPDVPPIESIIVEEAQPNGPYGVKGAGEMGIICTAAAISNAIQDAVGVPIRRLPVDRDDILNSLDGGST